MGFQNERDEGTMDIQFGTDGWRGIIADDFTFENVRNVSQAIADYILSKQPKESSVVVGYDTRFLSDRFAQQVASVLAANGVFVYLAKEVSPTPAISYAIKSKNASGGVMVTASHNPPCFNGLKFKGEYAGPASEEITNRIESHLFRNLKEGKQPPKIDFEEAQKQGLVKLFDPKTDYLKHLTKLIDPDVMRKRPMKIVIDPMYGAAIGYMRSILEEAGQTVIEIRSRRDQFFGGINPEPIEQNLQALSEAVIESNADIGLATDGDGDRIGAVDSRGNFVNPHQIFALLLCHLVENRKWHGAVAKTLSATCMIDILCQKFGLPLYVTPIGFKHICLLMLKDDILIGGEESGGIGIKGHLPERDGILAGLLIVELLATKGKSLEQLLADLRAQIGSFYYERRDIQVSPDEISHWVPPSVSPSSRINGALVKAIDRRDGVKYLLDNGSWLMIRASGTEPVIRIYAEAQGKKIVERLLREGQAFLTC